MYTNYFKKTIILLLIPILLFAFSFKPSFAQTVDVDGDDIVVSALSDHEILISDGVDVSKVEFTQYGDFYRLDVYDNGELQGYFLSNPQTHEIYSSFTDTLGNVEEDLSVDNIQPLAYIGSVTKYISYAELRGYVGAYLNVIAVASAMIAICSAMGWIVLSKAAEVANVIAGIYSSLNISGGDPNHGVVVKAKKYSHVKHQAGHTYTAYTYIITNAYRY